MGIPSDLVSYRDAARVAACSWRTITEMARVGRLRRYGTPGRYRVSLAEVLPEGKVTPGKNEGHEPSKARLRGDQNSAGR